VEKLRAAAPEPELERRVAIDAIRCASARRGDHPLTDSKERKVRPLGQVRLARITAPPARSLARRWSRAGRVPTSGRSRGRLHPVARVDVVLEEDRDAVQGPRTMPPRASRRRRGPETASGLISDQPVHSRSTLVEVEMR